MFSIKRFYMQNNGKMVKNNCFLKYPKKDLLIQTMKNGDLK